MSKIRGFGRPVLDPGKTLFERFPGGEHGQERARVGYIPFVHGILPGLCSAWLACLPSNGH